MKENDLNELNYDNNQNDLQDNVESSMQIDNNDKTESTENIINEVVSDINISENSNNESEDINTNTTVNQEQVLDQSFETEKKKKKNKLPLIIILLVLVVVLFTGVLLFTQKNKSTQNIYYKGIDILSSSLTTTFDKTQNNVKDLVNLKMIATIDINSNDKEIKDIIDTFDKLKLSFISQIDYKNKKMNIDTDMIYDDGSILKTNILVKDNIGYLNIPDLYDKPLKVLEDENIDLMFNANNVEDVRVFVSEFSNILKTSLKDEWFSKTKEKIEVMGNNVNAYNNKLTLTSKSIYELENTIFDKMLQNDKLLDAMSSLTKKNKDEIKTNITDLKSKIKETNESLEISIYLNNSNELQKVLIKSKTEENEEITEFSMTDVGTFDILVDKEKLGYLILKDDIIEMNLKDEEVSITFTLKDYYISMKMDGYGIKLEMSLTAKDSKGNIKILIDSLDEDMNMTLNIDFEEITDAKFNEFNVENAKNIEELTEEDTNKISENLSKNTTLLKLIEDLQTSSLSSIFKTEM